MLSNALSRENFAGGEIWIRLSSGLQDLAPNDAAEQHDPLGVGQ